LRYAVGAMKLYLISRTDSWSYDDYDSAVVAAPSEDVAKSIHPSPYHTDGDDDDDGWPSIDKVAVKLIGDAVEGTEAGVICASFNAG